MTDVSLDKEIRVIFWQSFGSGILIRIKTPDAERIRLDGALRCPSGLVGNFFTDYKNVRYNMTVVCAFAYLCTV